MVIAFFNQLNIYIYYIIILYIMISSFYCFLKTNFSRDDSPTHFFLKIFSIIINNYLQLIFSSNYMSTNLKSNNSDDFIIVDAVLEEERIVPTVPAQNEENDVSSGISSTSTEKINTEKASEKNSTEEKTLDLVFLMDCTGSMGTYISSAKENITSIVTRIIQTESCDVRFGLVAYRDHPPQESTYVTQVFEFVSYTTEMSQNLATLSAQGGGDGPEALTAGLYAAKHLAWREGAAKVVVLIADAPPHGLGESGDGFPNGDPDGLDPLVIAREMANLGIAIYTVGCEPALSHYRFAKSFMISLSELTGGKAVCLSSASLLADVILGGAIEEMNIQMLSNQLQSEIDSIREEVVRETSSSAAAHLPAVVERLVSDRLHERLLARGVRMAEMRTDGEMKDNVLSPQINACSFLSDVRKLVSEAPPAPRSMIRKMGAVSSAAPMMMPSKGSFESSSGPVPFRAPTSATTCEVVHESPSIASVTKMVSKAYRR